MSGPLRTKHPFLGGCGRVKIVNTFILNIAHSWPPWDKLSSVLWDESHRTQESTARIIWFLSYFSPTAGAAPMRGKVVAIEQIEHQLFLPLPNCWVTILLLSLFHLSALQRKKQHLLPSKQKAKLLPCPLLFCQLPPFICPLAICLQTENNLHQWIFLLRKKVEIVSATP